MKTVYWLFRFFIPFIVLYTIGYFVPGFSALTVGWITLLSVLIMIGDWVVEKIFPIELLGRFQEGIIGFLVSAVVIFTTTQAIEYGNVPLTGSLLAALLIGVLLTLVTENRKEVTEGKELINKEDRPEGR